jgi:glucose-1-phosphate adenylyltransferase
VIPAFDLYNERWPILTHLPSKPPAKFVHDDGDRVGKAVNSVVSNGVIVSGGSVRDSVLSPGVIVHSWASVDRAVILDGTRIGRRAVVKDTILDKNVVIGEGVTIGVDKDEDRARGLVVSDAGITVVGKGQEITK